MGTAAVEAAKRAKVAKLSREGSTAGKEKPKDEGGVGTGTMANQRLKKAGKVTRRGVDPGAGAGAGAAAGVEEAVVNLSDPRVCAGAGSTDVQRTRSLVTTSV